MGDISCCMCGLAIYIGLKWLYTKGYMVHTWVIDGFSRQYSNHPPFISNSPTVWSHMCCIPLLCTMVSGGDWMNHTNILKHHLYSKQIDVLNTGLSVGFIKQGSYPSQMRNEPSVFAAPECAAMLQIRQRRRFVEGRGKASLIPHEASRRKSKRINSFNGLVHGKTAGKPHIYWENYGKSMVSCKFSHDPIL